MDVLINKAKVMTHIGVTKEERREETELHIDIVITIPSPKEDSLSCTANYIEILRDARQIAAQRERQLVETLAQEIALHFKQKYVAQAVRVRISKPHVARNHDALEIGCEVRI